RRTGAGDAAGPVDLSGRAADAAGVRLPAARLHLPRRYPRHRGRTDRRGTPFAAALGATGGHRTGRRDRRPDRPEPALHRHPLPQQGQQRPAQPGLPVLHDPGRRKRLLMALPAPDLDDRRFQDLVDDAKRMVMRQCPEWTDHNVSDPGITLIETFAYMTDQMLFRLNLVPD